MQKFITLFFFLTLSICVAQTDCTLDASRINNEKTIKLTGPWKLYIDTLLIPSEAKNIQTDQSLIIPGYVTNPDNGFLKSGYGAHTVQIKLTGLHVDSTYALHIPEAFSSFNLFWDDSLIASNGSVSNDADSAMPEWRPVLSQIKATDNEALLTFHISNYSYKWCGFMLTPHLGTVKAIQDHHTDRLAIDLILFGAIAIIALYHISLYFLRKKDKTPLYFSLIATVFAIRTLVTGELLLTHFWKGIPWEILVKINFIGIALFLPLFGRYLHSLFPHQYMKKCMHAVDILSASYGVIVLLTPAAFHSHFLSPPFHLVLLFGCTTLVITMIKSMRANEPFSHYPFWAMIFLSATVVNDILASQNVIESIQLAPVGLVTFLFLQAFLISKKFSHAFYDAENYANELEELNNVLEIKVAERTQDLSDRNKELEEALAEVKTLSGLLPICAHCKKIKDDNGYWERIEEYFESHADIDFSHGLCPECAQVLYPDIDISQCTPPQLQ